MSSATPTCTSSSCCSQPAPGVSVLRTRPHVVNRPRVDLQPPSFLELSCSACAFHSVESPKPIDLGSRYQILAYLKLLVTDQTTEKSRVKHCSPAQSPNLPTLALPLPALRSAQTAPAPPAPLQQ